MPGWEGECEVRQIPEPGAGSRASKPRRRSAAARAEPACGGGAKWLLVGRRDGYRHHRAIDAVFRIEQAKLIAGLTRMVRDIGLAEELAQDALVAALEQWPRSGIPDNPGAWLMAAAKHRAIDLFRRNSLRERKHERTRL